MNFSIILDPRIVVHCPNGSGFSGTFIALYQLMDEIEKSSRIKTLDIFGQVLQLRQCRPQMVFFFSLIKLR